MRGKDKDLLGNRSKVPPLSRIHPSARCVTSNLQNAFQLALFLVVLAAATFNASLVALDRRVVIVVWSVPIVGVRVGIGRDRAEELLAWLSR